MFSQVYDLPNGMQITSIVLPEDAFNKLVDRIDKNNLSGFKKSKIIPGIKRGIATEWIFTKFNVKTDMCCICVKGIAKDLGIIDQLLGDGVSTPPPEYIDAIQKIYNESHEQLKKDIDATSDAMILLIQTNQTPEMVLKKFIDKYPNIDRKFRLNLLDQCVESMSITLSSARTASETKDDVTTYYRGYLRRLLISIHQVLIKKEKDNAKQTE